MVWLLLVIITQIRYLFLGGGRLQSGNIVMLLLSLLHVFFLAGIVERELPLVNNLNDLRCISYRKGRINE